MLSVAGQMTAMNRLYVIWTMKEAYIKPYTVTQDYAAHPPRTYHSTASAPVPLQTRSQHQDLTPECSQLEPKLCSHPYPHP